MNYKLLYNQKNKKELLDNIKNEEFNRITLSFYKYVNLNNLNELRDKLYLELSKLNVLGRIYISKEGINAQMSVPENNIDILKSKLYSYKSFNNVQLKFALQEGLSFLKLKIKVKKELVAYKISDKEYNMNVVGKHLDYLEFNQAIDDGALVVDMRNYYEGEVGKFKKAIIPDVDRSKDLLPEIKELLKGNENNKILMYCTGGIRCEKASSYLMHHGFKDINQLNGGIIKYANDIKKNNVKSKFIGKNFVFDNRLGERITDDVLSFCHICNKKCDIHTNCKNQACHILIIQCKWCKEKYSNCCSTECSEFILLPKEKQRELFKSGKVKFNAQKSQMIKPKLKDLKYNE